MANKPLTYLRKDVDLTSAPASPASIDIPNGIEVASVWVASLPAGITASLFFGTKQGIPLLDGLAIDFGECVTENGGVKIVFSPAAPGQTIVLIFGVGSGLAVG